MEDNKQPRNARGKRSGEAATKNFSNSPWGSTIQTRESQRKLKEEALYETAARWFNEYGFHGTSLADLATELGVTKAALYHYVPDKSELLYRLHMRSLEVADAARRRGTEEGSNGLDRIRLIIYHYVTAITSSPTFTFVLLEDGALSQVQADEILKRRRWLEHDLRNLISLGIKDGSIAVCDPKLAAFIIGGAMNSVIKWFTPGMPWVATQVASALSTMLSRMLSRNLDLTMAADVGALPCAPLSFAGDRSPKRAVRTRKTK